MSATQTSQRGTSKANGHKSGLAAKLVQARLAVGSVEKAGRNEQQKYDYAKAEDVAVAAEEALLDQGLLADLDVVDSAETPIKSRQGSEGLIVKAVCRLIVTDPDSGEQIERGAIGYGSDYPGDKAIYKAMTGARKYALIHLLGIKLGDDPDEERKGTPQATGAEKPSQVGTAIAKKLVDRAWEIEGAKRQLRLAVSHVAGRDVGDVDTKAKATKALSALDFDQAQRVEDWIGKKADEAAGDE